MPVRAGSIEVEVMEVFATSNGPSAVLIHHANEAMRHTFSEWLHSNNGTPVICRSRNGVRIDGRLFRMKMCFGRGLIITNLPVTIRPREVLIVT